MTPRWQPVEVKASSLPWPQRLAAVIAELGPTRNPRYKPGAAQTWCNVYATDVIAAMGVAAPRHWMMARGDPAAPGKGTEMTANLLWEWFSGPSAARYGWMRCDRHTAEKAAERGHLAVVCWRNVKGPGHIAVLLGEDAISQAGRQCFARGRISQGFGAAEPLEFFVQMERGGPPHP